MRRRVLLGLRLDRPAGQQELRGGNDDGSRVGREAGNYYFFLSFERIDKQGREGN